MWSQSYSSMPTVKYTTLKMPSNFDNSFTDVDVTVLVTREAFNNIGSFFTDVDVTVHFPLGMPLINIGTLHLANGA